MSFLKHQWQNLKSKFRSKPAPAVSHKKTTAVKPSVATPSIAKKAPIQALQKAQDQALKVDKALDQKGVTIPKGQHVTRVDSSPATPAWKPSEPLPAKRGRSRGKGMSL